MSLPHPARTAETARTHQLTPAAREIVDALTAAFPELTPETDVEAVRRATSQPPREGREPVSVVDRTVPGAASGTEIPVRLYRSPAPGPHHSPTPAPVLLFFHGGGFVLCGLDSHDGLCRELAVRTGALVVSVGYRLAPEHPAPAAAEDAYAALRWAAERAREEGGDPARIAVAGDSAGGNLATAACLLAGERGRPMPVAQFLAYPALDPRLGSASMREFGDPGDHFLTTAHMRWYWSHYLSGAPPVPHTAPALAPAEALAGLPPAYVLLPDCDPLRDEGRAYAARLPQAEVRAAPGMFHGFLGFGALLPEAETALAGAAEWLRNRLSV
ncbi:alpha/beta hydrolase fold domain-containing protein [Streptomyces iconiensis]|uniref:Alpha/beta hydrolase n=1 Tax=Streptomyces iconiensis TaxID=1384038 RepID=A0ABT7A9S8_9ACTN|nr:alpha/beta hydrolase [Streptomyces iconiensis]MDJ1138109.1 alpha/beta hydrolase [Streptomyces iconiensis]